jgi:hypothetical protein
MILGEEKVKKILDQSFENTLANWKDRAEKGATLNGQRAT